MKIAITGHRPNKIGDYDLKDKIWKNIESEIINIWNSLEAEYLALPENIYQSHLNVVFITGMALGIDTLFAKIAIENYVQFIAAIPCSGQDSKWPTKSQKVYSDIITHPLCTRHYVSDKPYNSVCMQNRNIWMANECNVLIAVWNKTPGGTANCVKYAESIGKRIIYINPNDLK